jgi:predicted nucleic acid-binding protein
LPRAQTFVDTLYVIALINERDQYHDRAVELAEALDGSPLLTTDAVLLEVGNALARGFKRAAAEAIETLLSAVEVSVVHLDPELFRRSFQLYQAHQDKEWGLVDCVSFTVMRDAGCTDALTCDRHFEQAGFRALLR